MVDLETINLLVQIVGVSAAVIATVVGVRSYIVSNKRAEEAKKKEQETRDRELETRQAQLFMQVYDPFRGKEFQKAFIDVRSMQFKDYQEFVVEKYNPEVNPELYASQLTVGNYFEGVGILSRGISLI
ncbi:hypothetical protein A3K78_02200 [Candidatus Bathyarchaeota archaeon RBG_13_52_12]|nr:MAG: hypothetical protein A3K78_02200 [Candidatus Bathyarchaeota archaeon RBG_13_52_12]